MSEDDVFMGLGVEIKAPDEGEFLKIAETLTRVGVESRRKRTLYQSCHILHKRGRYAIVHFKEMFTFDRKPSHITEYDIGRRNRIVHLLSEWGLIEILDENFKYLEKSPMSQVKVIAYKDKQSWTLESKYSIGVKL